MSNNTNFTCLFKLMDAFSDIAGLFSKLPYDASQYQEIGNFQESNLAASRWILLNEIRCSTSQSGSETPTEK